jgi:methyl-accepting chemotaxis protein
MAKGLFAGLFSQRSTPLLPVGLAPDALPALAPDRSFEFALEALPCNAMFCDRELILRYLNRSSRQTLQTLKQYLPVPVDQIVGKSIHIFHKNPQNVETILGGNRPGGSHRLPHQVVIQLGPEKLDLDVAAMTDERGN